MVNAEAVPLPRAGTRGGDLHREKIFAPSRRLVLFAAIRDAQLCRVQQMGGHNAGDVAARMAAEEIVTCIRQKSRILRRSPAQLLEFALYTAAVRVFTAAAARLEYRGMGTTVVACLAVDPTRTVIGHAGDSRAYLLCGGELAALTRDHTSAPHRLNRNLGREYGVQPDMIEVPLRPGDRLISPGSQGSFGPSCWLRFRTRLEAGLDILGCDRDGNTASLLRFQPNQLHMRRELGRAHRNDTQARVLQRLGGVGHDRPELSLVMKEQVEITRLAMLDVEPSERPPPSTSRWAVSATAPRGSDAERADSLLAATGHDLPLVEHPEPELPGVEPTTRGFSVRVHHRIWV